MAPRIPEEEIDYNETIQYHNFVEKPLPIKVNIRPGVKYYQPVEVLCYEEHFAFAFGYLFFDFNTTDLIYLCTYGNVCDEAQKHLPAQFKMKVWKDSSREDLLVVAQNERKSFNDESGTHYYADALCFPLPERDEYFASIWLVEDDNETLVRKGSFNAEDLANIYQEEQEHYYYHFREACCEEEDNYNLLEDITANEEECEEEPQDPEEPEDCVICDNEQGGKLKELTVRYLGAETVSLEVEQNNPGPGNTIIFDQESLVTNEGINLKGEASPGNNTEKSLWTELNFTIDNNHTYNLHTSCSEPLYPGLIFGDGNFEVVSAININDQNICKLE
jgi:hypothetical protein